MFIISVMLRVLRHEVI